MGRNWVSWMVRGVILALALSGLSGGLVRFVWGTNATRESWPEDWWLPWLLSGLALSWIWESRRTRYLRRLTQLAEDLSLGNRVQPLDEKRRDEWGRLAHAMNQLMSAASGRHRDQDELVNRLEGVLATMLEGVLAIDSNQRILFANHAAGRLLGFNSATAQGKKLVEVNRNRMLLDALNETLAASRDVARESIRYEIDSPESDGQILSLRASPLRRGNDMGVLIVLQDITELRRLEFLRQEFVANVSHELKTPLTAIKAYAETLRGGAQQDPQVAVGFLEQIETEADRLHELIIDLLQLARIESGHQSQKLEPLSVKSAIEAVIGRHLAPARVKSIEIEADLQQTDALVLADEEGLRQILDNLLDNAVKYTQEGGRVRLSWRVRDDFVTLTVTDDGPGIPQESLGRVFERFYRVDRARSRELGSTGLGLSIVKHLAQSFGGNVGVESKLGAGSTFSVTLPLAK